MCECPVVAKLRQGASPAAQPAPGPQPPPPAPPLPHPPVSLRMPLPSAAACDPPRALFPCIPSTCRITPLHPPLRASGPSSEPPPRSRRGRAKNDTAVVSRRPAVARPGGWGDAQHACQVKATARTARTIALRRQGRSGEQAPARGTHAHGRLLPVGPTQPRPTPARRAAAEFARKMEKQKEVKKQFENAWGNIRTRAIKALAPSRQRSSEPSRASLRPGIIPRRISARTKVSDERARRHRTGREVQHGHRRRCPVPASRLSPRRARGGRAIISPPFLPFSVLLVQRA
jgi:hypothetical protein